MKNMNPEEIIKSLDLKAHPEGGYFRETYRARGLIPASALPSGFEGGRAWSTAILYLLPEGQKSHLHRIRQDEVWHFYLGGPLRLVMIDAAGKAEEVVLGADVRAGQLLQFVVPAGHWFGAAPVAGGVFSLTGCTVAPGFDFADFEMASAAELKKNYPHLAGLINEFGSGAGI